MSHLFLFLILVFSDPSILGLQNYQSEFLNLINEKRRIGCKCNGVKYSKLPPLVWNKQLEIASQAHAEYIYKNKILTHRSKNGARTQQRLEKAGYSWRSFAENVAQGYDTPAEVLQAWIESPSHCQNLMGNYSEMAITKKGDYWVQDFGTPKILKK